MTYSKKIFAILIILFIPILHIVLISIDLQHDRIFTERDNNQEKHEFAYYLIHFSKILSASEFSKFISEISYYNIQHKNKEISVSLSLKPQWNPLLASENFRLNKLSLDDESVMFSYELKKGLWLNYKEKTVKKYYDMAVILSLLELFFISLILFYIYSLRRFTAPLKTIKESAERLGIDLNTQPLNEYGPSLVREAINAMNKMQTRIQNLIDKRTLMLAAISHDLRTPITRLKLRAHLIDDQDYSKKIIDDLDEVDSMIESILTFTSENSNQKRKITFDINALLASICEEYSDAGHKIYSLLAQQRIPFFGSQLALRRAINNIIQNAIKFSESIHVKLQQINNEVVIYVEDNGPGIPENELEKVFEPYYRGSQVNKSGTGLGLTIAYEIISDHQGKIELKNMSTGLLVIINLPNLNQL